LAWHLDGHAAFAAVERRVRNRQLVSIGIPTWTFDQDDVSSIVGQHAGRAWAGGPMAQVDHPQTLERAARKYLTV
jgi:hypothetical protein